MDRASVPPTISDISPAAAIPGGEFRIRGQGLSNVGRPEVLLGDIQAPLVVSSESLLVVRVPEGATIGEMVVRQGGERSEPYHCDIGIQLGDGLHPVASPAIDRSGNIFTTLSGPRGQKTPVSIYRIDLNYRMEPYSSDIMNASGLVVSPSGTLLVSSRYDGIVYEVLPGGSASVYVEGMGVATGLCLDPEGNLYVGDRSGTIFKIAPDRRIFVFATAEPSIAAYHLAWGPDGYLYMTGPTTSSFDSVYRIDQDGNVQVFFRGIGRPQGLAFDAEGNLYVAASMGGRRGVVRITPSGHASQFVSGSGIVGLAFSPSKAMIVTTTSAVYRLDVGIRGYQPEP
jgi:sugar lactone lactonase YvrE